MHFRRLHMQPGKIKIMQRLIEAKIEHAEISIEQCNIMLNLYSSLYKPLKCFKLHYTMFGIQKYIVELQGQYEELNNV